MALTRRWTRQDDFNGLVRAASAKWSVPAPLIKAVIAAESAFNPVAERSEAPRPSLPPTPDFPMGGDKSFGLMQLLGRTARTLGYVGSLGGLYDPGTNIDLGTKLLRQNLTLTGGQESDSVSAYNGGFRPERGFGERGVSGRYGNQDYVDRVLGYRAYFEAWERQEGGEAEGAASFPPPLPGSRVRPPSVVERNVVPLLMGIGALGYLVYFLSCRG